MKVRLFFGNIIHNSNFYKKIFNFNKTKKLKGLEGGLIIILLGLFYSAISIILSIKEYLISQINDGTFGLLTNPYSYFYLPGYKQIFLFETIGNMLIIFFILSLIYLFFCKHKLFPKLFKIYLLLYFLFILINNILYLICLNYNISLTTLLWAFIFMIIGGFYISISTRVKNTFIENSYKNKNILSIILIFTLLLLNFNIILTVDASKLDYNDNIHGNELCKYNYGNYSKYSGKIENGEFICECNDGYEFGGINLNRCVKKLIK